MNKHISKEMKRFNYLIEETGNAYHDMSAMLGVSDSVMQILYTICDYDDNYRCPLKEICRRTGISKQTINSAMRKLETENIIYLESMGSKNKDVCLTEDGKILAQRTAMKMIAAENDILDSWNQEDVNKYLELTERFLVSFKEKIKIINMD